MNVFVTAATSIIQSLLTNRKHKAELKQAVHKKQLDQISQGNMSASELDSISIQSRGWKDDFLLLVTIFPIIACFIPEMGTHIRQGFEVLKASVPEWYMYALALVFIDTFGFRRILRSVLVQYLTNRFGKKLTNEQGQ